MPFGASLPMGLTRTAPRSLAVERQRILTELQEKGLIDELRQALYVLDRGTRLFLWSRRKALEALFKVTKAIPKEWRADRWLWRAMMEMLGYQDFPHAYEKSLRHLRRLARKLATMTTDDDPYLVRALSAAYETGVLKLAERLPHPRTDGVEREVAEMLAKLAAYYLAGETWVLGRLRELLEQLEANWQKKF
jgi:hypothetical protein